jgi:outer membrane PBP1 activator LpoA protein
VNKKALANERPALGVMLILLSIVLAGCTDKVEERKFLAMPKELADCRVFYVQNRDGNSMTVVRCPNSATTTEVRSGKSTQTTVTIDGVEYAPVAK